MKRSVYFLARVSWRSRYDVRLLQSQYKATSHPTHGGCKHPQINYDLKHKSLIPIQFRIQILYQAIYQTISKELRMSKELQIW